MSRPLGYFSQNISSPVTSTAAFQRDCLTRPPLVTHALSFWDDTCGMRLGRGQMYDVTSEFSLVPQVDVKTTALAMAITDSELSDEEASILESGGFSVSRATTPQLTDLSEGKVVWRKRKRRRRGGSCFWTSRATCHHIHSWQPCLMQPAGIQNTESLKLMVHLQVVDQTQNKESHPVLMVSSLYDVFLNDRWHLHYIHFHCFLHNPVVHTKFWSLQWEATMSIDMWMKFKPWNLKGVTNLCSACVNSLISLINHLKPKYINTCVRNNVFPV